MGGIGKGQDGSFCNGLGTTPDNQNREGLYVDALLMLTHCQAIVLQGRTSQSLVEVLEVYYMRLAATGHGQRTSRLEDRGFYRSDDFKYRIISSKESQGDTPILATTQGWCGRTGGLLKGWWNKTKQLHIIHLRPFHLYMSVSSQFNLDVLRERYHDLYMLSTSV